MRALTERELEYVKRLVKRNGELIKSKHPDAHRLFYKGLEEPMGAAERKLRQRIRRKAFMMAFDLASVYAAGILPYQRGKDPFKTAKSAEGLVGRASDVILCMAIAETREEAMAFFKHLLKLVG
jgi:hypothetical protein